MITKTIKLASIDTGALPLGFVGETNHTRFDIRCDPIFDEFPNATVTMLVQAPDGSVYPKAVTVTSPSVYWVVTDTDTAVAGNGRVQLTFTNSEEIIKTVIASTVVRPSLQGEDPAPTPLETWVDEANETLALIDGLTVSSETLTAGSDASATVSETNGHYNIAFGIPQGEKGETGEPGDGGLIAPAFDAATANAAGSYVIYSGGLYLLPNGHTAGATWANTSKSSVTVGSELGTIKSAITLRGLPSGGTSGQILAKVSGTNYDVAWSPVGMPSDEQVDSAVSDWLDDHPEATTTVQDGAITRAKLNDTVIEDIDGKAPAILANTETAFSHEDVANPNSVVFHGNNYAFMPARYINAKNLMPGANTSYTTNGMDITVVGNFLTISNTATKASGTTPYEANLTKKIPAGNYKYYIEREEITYPPNASGKFELKVKYDVESPTWVTVWGSYLGSTHQDIANITFEHDVIAIKQSVGFAGNHSYNNSKMWFGLYDANAVVVDTEQTVSQTGTYTYDGVSSSLSTIDTMQHESSVVYVADTKTYIDSHIPDIIGFWNEHLYALPEDFGAIGNGITDDYQALADCLSYAATSGKPIRGYGKYKTTETIEISYRYADIYLREINYTGSDSAIELQNAEIKLEFHRITSTGDGICFGHNGQQNGVVASRCQINGNEINSTGDCIVCKKKTLYNTVEIRNLSSANGNCITSVQTGEGFGAAEYVYRGSSCSCPNGYVAENMAVSKFYDFTIEANCRYGFLNPLACMCIGCRHAEQTDGMKMRLVDGDTNYNNGPLIIFTEPPSSGNYGFVYNSWQGIPWYSIDVSQIQGYDTIPNDVGSTGIWNSICYTGIPLGVPIKGLDITSRRVIGNKMYFIGNNKVYVPEQRQTVIVDASTYDYRIFDEATSANMIASKNMDYGTDFIIDVSHSDIYFNASFGAVGYNDLTVTQADGNTCTIIDKLGNTLFDGTNEGDGKWSLKCTIDRESMGRLEYATTWWCYDGTNETWEITKLS